MNSTQEDRLLKEEVGYDFWEYTCVIAQNIEDAMDSLRRAMQAANVTVSLHHVQDALQSLGFVETCMEEVIGRLEKDIDFYRGEFAWHAVAFHPQNAQEQTLLSVITKIALTLHPGAVFERYRELLEVIVEGLGAFIEGVQGTEVKVSDDTDGVFMRPSPLRSTSADEETPVELHEQIIWSSAVKNGLPLLIRMMLQRKPENYRYCAGFLLGALREAFFSELLLICKVWRGNYV